MTPVRLTCPPRAFWPLAVNNNDATHSPPTTPQPSHRDIPARPPYRGRSGVVKIHFRQGGVFMNGFGPRFGGQSSWHGVYHRRRRTGVSYGITDLAPGAWHERIGCCCDWIWLWVAGVVWRSRADAQAPWYCTGISSFSMTWSSPTISVASSS